MSKYQPCIITQQERADRTPGGCVLFTLLKALKLLFQGYTVGSGNFFCRGKPSDLYFASGPAT